MATAQPEIFFSYAWGGYKEKYAHALYDALQAAGYKVVMDRHEVQYSESFTQFMLRIGRGAFIIVIISDKYLRSPFCMFELLEIYRKSNSELGEMAAKVIPVVMGDANIYDDAGILQYTKYWRQKTNDLRSGMTDDMDLVDTVDFGTKLKRYNEIANNMTNFGLWLQDTNIPKPEVLAANNYEHIVTAIANHSQQVEKPQASDGLPHHLTAHPFISEVFFGRVEELAEIHTKLFEGDNLLLLVNGMGGVGKTTLATHYYYSYANEYAHLAWVLSEKSIANALLLLAVPLGIRFEDTMFNEARMQVLLARMANLNKPCLLVIDNANELEDLQANYVALRSCPNFHLLLTTRIDKFEKAPVCKIGALPYDIALELFTEHYTGHDAAEDELFKKVYEAVDGNTLIIELLAKNLYVQNLVRSHYPLSELVADLQKGLLSISKTKPVSTHYHSDTLLKGEPLDIIAAMYDIGELTAPEKRLLSNLAVLPAENIPFAVLESLLPDTSQLEETLINLSLKGWIEHNQFAAAFKISPVIQEITRAKNTDLLGDCKELIGELADKLLYEPVTGHFLNSSYQEAGLYARYGETVVGILGQANENIARLLEYLGNYHRTTGDLRKALALFELSRHMQQQLCNKQSDNENHKNNLSVLYSKLGETYASMGNLPKALQFYEDYNHLRKELLNDYPNNVGFKNGLAISYSKLGETYASMGNLQEALRFYTDQTTLFQQLDNAYPDNGAFKNGLAVSYQKLGKTYASMGNLQEALRFYNDNQLLMQQLHNAYPDNVAFKNGLAISYSKLGETYASMGNLQEALRFYNDIQLLMQQLYEAYPDNGAFKNGLAVSYQKLGKTYASMGNLQEALRFYNDNQLLMQQLHNAYPDNVAFKNGLAVSYQKLGETHASMGNLQEAFRFYTECLRLGEQLYDAYPDNVAFKNGLAVSYIRLGLIYEAQEEPAKTRELNEKAKAIWQQLVNDSPEYAEFKNNLEWVNSKLA
jgi:tetratricopeptide (TPR) repeat protein